MPLVSRPVFIYESSHWPARPLGRRQDDSRIIFIALFTISSVREANAVEVQLRTKLSAKDDAEHHRKPREYPSAISRITKRDKRICRGSENR